MKRLYFDILDSTNEKAKRMLRNKEISSDTLIRALEQSSGKGRLGRSWLSKKGEGLYLSIIKEVDINKNPSILTVAAAIAVFKSLESFDVKDLGIKWPNDILIGSKKLCGILSELIEVDGRFFAIIGIGINVNNKSFSEDLTTKATSLFLENVYIDMMDLMDNLELSFEEVYNKVSDRWNLEKIVNFLNDHLIGIGNTVEFNYKGTKFLGIIDGINADGSLRIISEGRLMDIFSGEITLKGLYK